MSCTAIPQFCTHSLRNSIEQEELVSTKKLPLHLGYCKFGWTYYDALKQCYKLFEVSLNQPDARAFCVGEGADLVSITSQEEQTFAYSKIQGVPEKEVPFTNRGHYEMFPFCNDIFNF